MLVYRSLLKKVGYFDESLSVGEDTKIIFRLAGGGYRYILYKRTFGCY